MEIHSVTNKSPANPVVVSPERLAQVEAQARRLGVPAAGLLTNGERMYVRNQPYMTKGAAIEYRSGVRSAVQRAAFAAMGAKTVKDDKDAKIYSLKDSESTSAGLARLCKESRGEGHFFLDRPLIEKATLTGPNLAPQTMLAGIPGIPYAPLRLQDYLTQYPVNENLVHYVQVTRAATAAVTSDGDTAPEAAITYTAKEGKVRSIRHWHRASSQILADSPNLFAGETDTLIGGVADELEDQIVSGAGGADELPGILLSGNHVAHVASTGVNVLGAIAIGHRGIVDAKGRPGLNGVNPGDLLDILEAWALGTLSLGGALQYVNGVLYIFGVVTVATTAVPPGVVITMDRRAVEIPFRRRAEVRAYREDANNVTTNLVTLMGEQPVALVHRDPGLVHVVELTA